MLNSGCEPTYTQNQCLLDFEFSLRTSSRCCSDIGNQHLKNFHFLPNLSFRHQIKCCLNVNQTLKGQCRQNERGFKMFNFQRRQQRYHLFACETDANRAITAQSWDYLVYLRDLAVHKDRLPHHNKTSQSALE